MPAISSPAAFPITSRIDAFALLGAHDAWAVGDYQQAVGDTGVVYSGGPIAYHWDGSAWRQVPVPNNSRVVSGMSTVPGWGLSVLAVFSPTSILAMGGGGTSHFTLWNGKRWTVVPTAAAPGAPADQRSITGMSALNAQDIWAVGGFGPEVVEHWEGRLWHAIPYMPAG